MLTIDAIVEKYQGLDWDKVLAANLRRHGLSATRIAESIAELRRSRAVEEVDRQQRAMEFRLALTLKGRADQITAYLSLFSSTERAVELFASTMDEPDHVFWPVWIENWNICDAGLWADRRIFLETLRRRSAT